MKTLMLGNEAIARGAWEAGVRVATAYPGTPSTEVTEYIAQYKEIDAEWSVNEKVALEVAIGASVAGARAVCTMKHVGLNVAMDPLLSISYPGVNAGLVVVVADDPGQHSSQNEQDTRYFGMAGKLPVLEPSDSRECRDFMIRAFEISEEFDIPVIVRTTTRVAHAYGLLEPGGRMDVPLREYDSRFGKYMVAPAFSRRRRVVAEERLGKLREFAETTDLNIYENGSSDTCIITGSIAYQYCREVMPNAGFCKLGLSYPLPERKLKDFCGQHKKVFVVEELEPIFEQHLKALGVPVIGKAKVPVIGELSTEIVRKGLTDTAPEPVSTPFENLPVRPPVLCPGCHHRGPFYVMKKLKLKVAGDIGCYTLTASPPLSIMDTAICMGAGIGMAFGMQKARGKDFAGKSIAVIGDSTFWHSGMTGLVDIVYNRGITTVVILDNSITAMTGHQENPSSGRTLNGESAPALSFADFAKSIGIKHVREVDAFNLKELETVMREELAREEPSVIITKRTCILHPCAVRHFPLKVNPGLCKSCMKCLSIGCPAISFDGDKVKIDQVLCVGCELCAGICPFHAIEKQPLPGGGPA